MLALGMVHWWTSCVEISPGHGTNPLEKLLDLVLRYFVEGIGLFPGSQY